MLSNNTDYSYFCTYEKKTINDYSKSSCLDTIMAFVFAVGARFGWTVEVATEMVEGVAVYPISNDAISVSLNRFDS